MVVDLNGEMARQSPSGQGEVGGAGAILVGGDLHLAHLLIVGIAQADGHLLASLHLVVASILSSREDGSHMDGLSRPIDGTVGIDGNVLSVVAVFVVVIVAYVAGGRTGLVGLGVGEELVGPLIAIAIDGLSLTVHGQRGGLLALAIAGGQLQRGSADGLTGGGVHHDVAQLVAGQSERQHTHIAHKVELTGDARGGLRLGLNQIDAYGQSVEHHAILERLVGLVGRKGDGLRMCRQRMEQGLQLLVVLRVVGRIVDIALHISLVHPQGELVDAPEVVEVDRLLAVGDGQAVEGCLKLKGRQAMLTVAERVQPRPIGEAAHHLFYIVPLLGRRGIGLLVHAAEALQHGLAHLGQVGVGLDDGVELRNMGGRGVWLVLVGIFRLVEGPQGHQESSPPVACSEVVVASHIVAPSLPSQQAEQVVGKETLAVAALLHQRLVVGGPHGSQLLGMSHRQGIVVAGHLLVALFERRDVVLVDIAQHGAIDSLQGRTVGCRVQTGLQLIEQRRERVGGHLTLHTGGLQLGL